MQINVEGRNTEVRQTWRDLIENKLTKCERYPNEITHARVTISHSPHHQQGDNQVQVVLSVSGRTLTVKKHGAQIPAVLRSALTAAERELAGYHENRKRFIKKPLRPAEPPETGQTMVPQLTAPKAGSPRKQTR
ncbi:MAG: ribosome-associated translation inhibitor RaiA [Deltaproteobacteria bacterium]|nr:ribosome-associated translation inhibitor RaiA [Deltaproteobacteria bacterium]